MEMKQISEKWNAQQPERLTQIDRGHWAHFYFSICYVYYPPLIIIMTFEVPRECKALGPHGRGILFCKNCTKKRDLA